MDIERMKALLPEVVALVETRLPYATAEATSRTGASIVIDNREKAITPDPSAEGIVISASNGLYLEEYATTTLDRDKLLAEVKTWLDGVKIPQDDPQAPLNIQPLEPLQQDFIAPFEIDPRSIPLPQKLEQLSERQAHANELDARIINASIRYNESRQQTVFAGHNRLLSQELTRLRLTTMLMVRDSQGNMQYDWHTDGGAAGYELLDWSGKKPNSRTAEQVLASALELLSAEPMAPGYYDCITPGSVSGIVAHESFGHGVETDMFLKGRALAADYLGQRMSQDYVNMSDDPTVSGAYGSYFFDDEGEISRTVPIIENGIFSSGISDLYSAARLGIKRTGNGRRQNFAHKAYARMSNTFFMPGDTPVEDMIAGVDSGVLLLQPSGGMEDPKGWGIQIVMHYAREIKNGKLTGRMFSPVAMTGSVPEVLGSISQVGNDFSLLSAFCGKGHKEYVMVSSGGPHLRLRARLS